MFDFIINAVSIILTGDFLGSDIEAFAEDSPLYDVFYAVHDWIQ